MLLTLGVALLVWVSREPERTEVWVRSYWLPNTTGVAKRSSDGEWSTCAVIDAMGDYCYYAERGSTRGSDARWFEVYGIQLPEVLAPGGSIDLRMISDSAEGLHEMKPGEMTANLWAHSGSFERVLADDSAAVGTLKIISNDGKVIVLEIDVSLLTDGHAKWEIKRQLRFEKIGRLDPLLQLPEKRKAKG